MYQLNDRVVLTAGPDRGQLGHVAEVSEGMSHMKGLYKVRMDCGGYTHCSGTALQYFETPKVKLEDLPRLLEILQVSLATLRNLRSKDCRYNISDLLSEAKVLGIDVGD